MYIYDILKTIKNKNKNMVADKKNADYMMICKREDVKEPRVFYFNKYDILQNWFTYYKNNFWSVEVENI